MLSEEAQQVLHVTAASQQEQEGWHRLEKIRQERTSWRSVSYSLKTRFSSWKSLRVGISMDLSLTMSVYTCM